MKLIIFDFDGTLGDTRRNIVTTMQMTIAQLGLPKRSDSDCAATIGLPLTGCFTSLYPDMQSELIQLCTDTYRQTFDENLHTIKPQTFPHVVETLKQLKTQGLILTIASSRSHASLVELVQDLIIADYITYMVGADDVREAKPNPEPVVKTLEAMTIRAEETLVVGDMAVDVLMGSRAGTLTCGVTWGNGTEKELVDAGADHIIHDMAELPSVIAEL